MGLHAKPLSGIHIWLTALLAIAAFSGAPRSAAGQDDQVSQTQPTTKSSAPQTSSQPKAASSQAQSSSRPKLKTFSSPQEAADALYSAARNHDEDGLLVILGPDSKDVIVWTDDPADRKADADLFAEKYGQMHRLVREPDNETTLYVGAENWPLPIPLVEKDGAWYFDSGMGKREILYRRIGENELETIDVLRAMVDAENEYYSEVVDASGEHEYARKFNSEQGQRNGLYWPGSKEPDESPIGPYLAQASYNRSDRKPLRGYYFRILTEQGKQAPGGPRKYIVNGKMTGGFAFVAFPAEYRASGVKTFIVNQGGVVYEKDLGPMTEQLAKSMAMYNPDSTWTKVQ
jgi:DUF2950 family protein